MIRVVVRTALLLIAVVAVAAIAFGQALVIHDGLVVAHPAWSQEARWVVAIGFELAILVTGVAIMATGADRLLIIGELLLVTLSIAVGLWTIYSGAATARWIVALSLGLLPAQYLVATYSLHRLYVVGHAAPVTDQVERNPSTEVAAPAPPPAVAVQVHNQVLVAGDQKAERQAILRGILAEDPTLSTRELMSITGASKATIARDLAELRRQEAIHG